MTASRQLGGALAVAVFGALVADEATFLRGLRISLLIAALLPLTAAAGSLLLRPAPAAPAARADVQTADDLRQPSDPYPRGDQPMTTWTDDELRRIAAADELDVAPLRPDRTLRTPVTVWVVRHGDDLYVRSYRGPEGAWFRAARTSHEGRVRSGGVDKDVTFVEAADPGVNEAIDAAYRTKYRRYGAAYLDPMLAPQARGTTLKLVPR